MVRQYTNDDLEKYENQEEEAPTASGGSDVVASNIVQQNFSSALASPQPPPPPKKKTNPHLAGLMEAFYGLIRKSEDVKYARTAANFQGLANVVGNMAGAMMEDSSRGQNNAIVGRGQTLDYLTSQDKTRLGLAELAGTIARDASTAEYQRGTLAKMGKQLGLEGEKLAFEREKFGPEMEVKTRALGIAEGRNKLLEERGGLVLLQKELGMLTRQRAAGLSKIIATQGIPKNEASWLRQIARKVPGIGNYVEETAPNDAMKSLNALEQLYQGAVSETLGRYGVTPQGGETNKPYWETLLEGE